jgi:hypothetical protein
VAKLHCLPKTVLLRGSRLLHVLLHVLMMSAEFANPYAKLAFSYQTRFVGREKPRPADSKVAEGGVSAVCVPGSREGIENEHDEKYETECQSNNASCMFLIHHGRDYRGFAIKRR